MDFQTTNPIIQVVAVNRKPLEIKHPGVWDFPGNCKPPYIMLIMEAHMHATYITK